MNSLNKVLVICGPTATGKTDLAVTLSNYVNSDIIACDSRQVYQGMDIGTGKDIPPGFTYTSKPIRHYHSIKSNLYGVDLVSPNLTHNAIDYREYALKALDRIHQASRLPIFTVGTGLYIKSLFNPPKTAYIPPNSTLRQSLSHASINTLQTKLQALNHKKWAGMNHSDRHNPRRLIRAIETSVSPKPPAHPKAKPYDLYWVGLTATMAVITQRIIKRVQVRAGDDFSQEIKALVQKYPNIASTPSFTATGYKEWSAYLKHKTSRHEAKEKWTIREIQYAKRQMTWFKTMSQIHWFDITQSHWQDHVVASVKTWYAKKNEPVQPSV